MSEGRVVIAGGSGFIGSALSLFLHNSSYEVVVLTRDADSYRGPGKAVHWDGKTVSDWKVQLDGALAVVNLAGKSINTRFTPDTMSQIVESRVESVKALSDAINGVDSPPQVWVQASATGYYGDTGDRVVDEMYPPGDGFLAETGHLWETAFNQSPVELRKAVLRFSMALGKGGGAFPVLSKLTKSFLGGAAGNGRQYMSWIHLYDAIRVIRWVIQNTDASGAYNAVAPTPLTNADFMREMRKVYRKPWSPPAPKFAVKLGARIMGSEPELVFMSNRSIPQRLLDEGFRFEFPELWRALIDLAE